MGKRYETPDSNGVSFRWDPSLLLENQSLGPWFKRAQAMREKAVSTQSLPLEGKVPQCAHWGG